MSKTESKVHILFLYRLFSHFVWEFFEAEFVSSDLMVGQLQIIQSGSDVFLHQFMLLYCLG